MTAQYPQDAPHSPYIELHSRPSRTLIAELPGVTEAKELELPENTPRPPQIKFDNDVTRRSDGPSAVVQLDTESRNNTERRYVQKDSGEA